VLRRWDLNAVLPARQIATAIDELMAWPLRATQVRGLFSDAWAMRARVTFADAMYVALAEHLGGPLLTDDRRLANTPGLSVQMLSLP
jgi:predicted nucleic acid-binding protein